MQSAAQLANLIPFTTQNASEMGLRGAIASNKVQADKRMTEPVTLDSGTAERLALIAEQIALTRARLKDDDVEDKDRASLLRALTSLLDQERIWSGRPLPGTLKPTQEPRQSQRRTFSEPRPVSEPEPKQEQFSSQSTPNA